MKFFDQILHASFKHRQPFPPWSMAMLVFVVMIETIEEALTSLQCYSHLPTPEGVAWRWGVVPDHPVTGLGRGAQAEQSERHALPLGRLWVQGPCLGAGPRQTIYDREIARIVG